MWPLPYSQHPQAAEEVLGWRSTRSLRSMCSDMWRWQTANPGGFLGVVAGAPEVGVEVEEATPGAEAKCALV